MQVNTPVNPTEQIAAATGLGGPTGAASPVQVLRVRTRNGNRSVPLTELDGVIECPPTSPVPAAPTWLLGVAAYKGGLMSVVDLAAACGDETNTPRRPADRLLLVETGLNRIAYSVDAILSQDPETPDGSAPAVALRALSARLISIALPAGQSGTVAP